MSSGSYDFDRLNDTGYQTDRLMQQARAVRAMEANILRQAGIQPGHDVLEIGSGPGFVTDLLTELAFDGSVHAVEPSATLLAQVDSNVSRKPGRGLHLHQALGNALPLADGSIDFSYARFVLQHVPSPQSVVDEVFRVTRPKGRFCAVDSDDGLVIVHPDEPRVSEVLSRAQTIQSKQGGDRFIGRKLQAMMVSAGFAEVGTHVLAITSTELPFVTLFNIALGYKASLLGDTVDPRRLYEDLASDVASGRRMFTAGVFIVTGTKT